MSRLKNKDLPNFNPASVTNEICLRQNFNPNGRMFPLGLKLGSVSPQEVPKKGPETCILDKKSGTCWGQMLPAKIREAFGNQAQISPAFGHE